MLDSVRVQKIWIRKMMLGTAQFWSFLFFYVGCWSLPPMVGSRRSSHHEYSPFRYNCLLGHTPSRFSPLVGIRTAEELCFDIAIFVPRLPLHHTEC